MDKTKKTKSDGEANKADRANLNGDTVCERARAAFLAKKARILADHFKQKENFLNTMFSPNEYVRNEDGTYTICGWKWRVHGNLLLFNYRPALSTFPYQDNYYRGILLNKIGYISDTPDFGEALLKIDKQIEEIDAKYPNNFWGNLKLKISNIFRSFSPEI